MESERNCITEPQLVNPALEKPWKIAWNTAPELKKAPFLDPATFDVYALPAILRRISLFKDIPSCHKRDANPVESGISSAMQFSNPVVEEEISSTPSGTKRKKKKKKSEKNEVWNVQSSLTAAEQQRYLHLLKVYGDKVCTEITSEEKSEIELLARLHAQVVHEQQTNNQYLRETMESRKHIYSTLHPDAHQYLQDRLRLKLACALQVYPQFYNIERILPVVSATKEPKVTAMTVTDSLLDLGIPYNCFLDELKTQSICLPLEYAATANRFPINEGEHPSQQLITRDNTALTLAEEHDCQIVCSLSGLRTLLTGLISPFESTWHLPLQVKGINEERNIVMLDKPLAQGQVSSRQRNSSYHKYAARLRLAKNIQPCFSRSRKAKAAKEAASCVKDIHHEVINRPLQSMDIDDLFGGTQDICELETFGSGHSVLSASLSLSRTAQKEPEMVTNEEKMKPVQNVCPISVSDSNVTTARGETDQLSSDSVDLLKQKSTFKDCKQVEDVVNNIVSYVSDQLSDTDSDAMVIDDCVEEERNSDPIVDVDSAADNDHEESINIDNNEDLEMPELQLDETKEIGADGQSKSSKALPEPGLAVNYSVVALGDIRLLVRSKIHGLAHKKPVQIFPKMQYISSLGCEEVSAQELVEQWVSLLVKPDSTIVRVHVDAKTSHVLLIQEISSIEQLLSGCNGTKFSPHRFLDQLHQVLKSLISLKSGQYLLAHHTRESVAHLYRHADKRGGYDLHSEIQQHLLDVNSGHIQSKDVPFLPLDPDLTLPMFQGSRVPGLFPPKPQGLSGRRRTNRRSRRQETGLD